MSAAVSAGRSPFLFCLVSLLFLALLPRAASADGTELPRYWTAEALREGSPQAFSPSGAESLNLRFTPQEEMCAARYGDQWYAVCARPTGLAGKPAPGAALEPAMPGVWRWADDRLLTFTPAAPWPAGTRYEVKLPESALPSSTRMTHPLAFVTRGVEAEGEGNFRVDPQNPREMAVSGVIRFNYPMRRESVAASAMLPDGGKALIGEPVFLWNEGGDALRFSVPVRALDEQGRMLRVSVARGCMASSGGKPGEGVELNVSLPGRHDLFRLNSAEAVVVTGADMRARQALALEFSLPVSAREARKALSVRLLPRQKAESADNTPAEERPPYVWWSAAELTPEVLARSRAVSLTLPEDPDAAFATLGFGFDEELEPGRYLQVSLGALSGKDGFSTGGGVSFLVRVPEFPEELRILQKGNVLALGGEGKLSLYSRNLDSVRWKAWQVRSSFINQFAGMNEGDFSSPALSETQLNSLSVIGEGELPLTRRNASGPQFSALDLAPLLRERADGRRGLFVLHLTGLRDGEEVSTERRFVLVTDLGLIRKAGADGSGAIYAASLSSGRPASGVAVRVIGANGIPVFEAESDEAGKVSLPDLSGLRDDRAPVAIVAERRGDLAFLPWGGWAAASLETDFSRFDVHGETETEDGLNVFLFGERDMYRPGESMHAAYIVRQSGGPAMREAMKNLPLRAELLDPRGNTAAAWDLFLPESGFGELEYPVAATAPTGLYSLELRLRDGSGKGELLRALFFRVEEFQPDTLRLNVAVSPRPAGGGWLRPQDLKEGLAAGLELENLFGAPASGARVEGRLDVSPAVFSLPGYSGWHFHDAAPLARASSRELGEEETGADGAARFVLPADAWSEASCRLDVTARGFEPGGGRSVTARASVMVSPLEYVLGWKSPSELDWLPQGGKAELSLLAVDSSLAPRALGEVTLETLGVIWTKSLIRDERGMYRYENMRRETPLASAQAVLGAEERKILLDTSTPGERVLAVRAADGTVLARIPYVVAGTAPVLGDALRDPVLRVNLDRKDYNPGETMKVMLTTPYRGAGLITVERERVVAEKWFRSEGGTEIREIALPSDFEGRAYLNVTYFRSPDDRDIFTRPHAALAQPFTVNMARRDLELSLEPRLTGSGGEAVARPGGDLPVEVRAKRPCRAVVFAVDEGVLQLTGFKTPDPLRAMLGDRALQVRTSQYFDLLMPEYGLLHAALAAYGGGEGLKAAAMGQNPFRRPGEKSVAFWSGIVDAGPEARTVNIPLPDYFSGQLRIMAVAYSADGDDWGLSSCRRDVRVQAEVVLRPSFPLFVAPGDEFEAALTMTDMSGLAPGAPDGGSASGRAVPGRRLRVSVEPGAGLELLTPPPAEVELYHARSRTVTMRLRATERLGGDRVLFRVAPPEGEQGREVTRSAALSVRPAIPRAAAVSFGRMTPSASSDGVVWKASRRLRPEFSAFSATASALPLPVVRGFIGYLNACPYGCTEQLISAAFPALVMLSMPEFVPAGGSPDAERLRAAVREALSMLAARSDGGGNFSMWPGSWARENLLLSTYAADFLTTAKEAGIMPPYNLERSLLAGLEEAASSVPGSLHDARVRAYAAWVLTRNGVLTSNILANLDAWLNRHVTADGRPAWSGDIAAVFMGGCWQLMMRPEEGRKLVEGFTPDPVRAWSPGVFDGLAARAFYLSVLAGQFPDMLGERKSMAIVDEMLELASSGSFTTFSAAQTSRAMLACARALRAGMDADTAGKEADAALEALDASGAVLARGAMTDGMARIALEQGQAASSPSPADVASLRLKAGLPLFWEVLGTGFDAVLPSAPEYRGMEAFREIRDREGNTVMDGTGRFLRAVKQGEELIVILHVRAYDRPADNVAVSDILPGGLEMIMAEGGGALEAGLDSIPGGTKSAMLAPDHAERREDRMLLFTSVGTGDGVFAYRARAVTRGEFTLPPLHAEAMYDPRLSATGAAGRMVVE